MLPRVALPSTVCASGRPTLLLPRLTDRLRFGPGRNRSCPTLRLRRFHFIPHALQRSRSSAGSVVVSSVPQILASVCDETFERMAQVQYAYHFLRNAIGSYWTFCIYRMLDSCLPLRKRPLRPWCRVCSGSKINEVTDKEFALSAETSLMQIED